MLQFWRSLLHSQNPSCQICLFVHPKCEPDGTLYHVQIFIITLKAFIPESRWSLITEDMGVSYKEYTLWMYDLQPTVMKWFSWVNRRPTWWRWFIGGGHRCLPTSVWPTMLLFYCLNSQYTQPGCSLSKFEHTNQTQTNQHPAASFQKHPSPLEDHGLPVVGTFSQTLIAVAQSTSRVPGTEMMTWNWVPIICSDWPAGLHISSCQL